MGNLQAVENANVKTKDFFQSKLETAKYSGRSIFPDGVNFSDLKKVIERQTQKDYFLFAVEGSKLIFSKAAIRGNTPYGFWIEQRLEEITEEIQFFNKINEKEKKSNMLNILLTIDRNGLEVNQLDTWNIFKKETTKYITRIKRVLKERFGIDSIGHFRVFEAHASGHCHAHLCLILKDCLDYELIYKHNSKTGRGAFSAELKDKDLAEALSQWHFSNGHSIGKESISAVYSTERLINYLTKYYSKNQTFIKNSYDNLVNCKYDESDPKSKIKIISDMKKVMGFYYAIKTNVRLFRHSIKKDERINFIKSQAQTKENLLKLVNAGFDVKKVSETLKMSEKRVMKIYYSLANPLANEPKNNIHEDFKTSINREYLGICSKKTLDIAFDISNMGSRAAFKGIYENEISPDGKKRIIEGENLTKCEEYFQGQEKKEKEIIGFQVDLQNMPVIQGFQEYKKIMEAEGKKVSLGRYLTDFCTWKEKSRRLYQDQIEAQKLFNQEWIERAKNAKRKKTRKAIQKAKIERKARLGF